MHPRTNGPAADRKLRNNSVFSLSLQNQIRDRLLLHEKEVAEAAYYLAAYRREFLGDCRCKQLSDLKENLYRPLKALHDFKFFL